MDRSPAGLVAEVQLSLKSGTAFWNADTGDVEVDMTGSYR